MQDKISKYYELLKLWNRRINLTSVDDEDGFKKTHVEDSLALINYLGDARRIIDLGTGAGIPGFIIKFARPNVEVTLLDATRKKIAFCDEVIRKLELKDVFTVWGRAEDSKLAKEIGKFDLVVSRATWELSKFVAIAHMYVSPAGRVIAMKGKNWAKELAAAASALEKSRLTLSGTHPYKLSGGEERCLVEFEIIPK